MTEAPPVAIQAPTIPEAKTITPEKENFMEAILKADPKEFQKICEILSMMFRAFEGKDVNPDNDPITRLINVKNILERSNFPTMPHITFQVYTRLIAETHPELEAFKTWANLHAEALKSLKSLSSEQYVDMYKAQNGTLPQQQGNSFFLNPNIAQQQQQKKSIFRRERKERQLDDIEE